MDNAIVKKNTMEEVMEDNLNQVQPNGEMPGKGSAVASLVLGIVSVVLWFFGFTAIGSLILGIVGVILASVSKKAGNTSGVRTAGFVLSLIGLIVGGIVFVACVACAGCIGAAAGTAGLFELF